MYYLIRKLFELFKLNYYIINTSIGIIIIK